MTLIDNKVIITQQLNTDFRIVSGRVDLYIVIIRENRIISNRFFCTCGQGTVIPALCEKKDSNGKADTICFKLKGGPEAEIEEIIHSPENSRIFLNLLSPSADADKDQDPDTLLRAFLEENAWMSFNQNNVAISENIRRDEEKHREIHEDTADVFIKPSIKWQKKIPDSGHPLYDAITFACRMSDMPEADAAQLIKICGEDFTPEDYARNAGFICREIEPYDGWKKDDIGSLLILSGNEKHPYVVYRRAGRVRCMDMYSREEALLKKTDFPEPTLKIYSLVRPLPAGTVSWKDMLKLTLAQFRIFDVVTMICATLLATGASLLNSTLCSWIYGLVIPYSVLQFLGPLAILVLTWAFSSILFEVGKTLTNYRMSSRTKYALQGALYDRLFHLKESYFQGKESAQVAYRTECLAQSYSGIFSAVINILMMLVSVGLYIQKMMRYSATLTEMTAAFTLVSVLCTVGIGYFTQKNQMKISRLTSVMRSYLYQIFSGILTIRATSSADKCRNQYLTYYKQYGILSKKRSIQQIIADFLVSALSFAAIVVAYYYMAGKNLGISTSVFLSFLSVSAAFTGGMTAMASNVLRIYIMYPMLKDGSEILNAPSENVQEGEIVQSLKGDLELRNVYFRYTKGGSPWVLENISLHIHPGEHIGIVGTSGCGKSTLFRLILGFEQPEKGLILFDHNDINGLNKVSLRRCMGTVLQSGVLFSGTIYKNISISNPEASYEDVQKAAELACILEDIEKMPLGFATPVSEETETISGGQKQRIMIARAILGNPGMLLLDEATSALDNISQAKVQAHLDNLKCTRISIAHRLSTVKNCDRILVMDQGTIAEEGTYDELMDKKGLFYQMAKMQ